MGTCAEEKPVLPLDRASCGQLTPTTSGIRAFTPSILGMLTERLPSIEGVVDKEEMVAASSSFPSNAEIPTPTSDEGDCVDQLDGCQSQLDDEQQPQQPTPQDHVAGAEYITESRPPTLPNINSFIHNGSEFSATAESSERMITDSSEDTESFSDLSEKKPRSQSLNMDDSANVLIYTDLTTGINERVDDAESQKSYYKAFRDFTPPTDCYVSEASKIQESNLPTSTNSFRTERFFGKGSVSYESALSVKTERTMDMESDATPGTYLEILKSHEFDSHGECETWYFEGEQSSTEHCEQSASLYKHPEFIASGKLYPDVKVESTKMSGLFLPQTDEKINSCPGSENRVQVAEKSPYEKDLQNNPAYRLSYTQPHYVRGAAGESLESVPQNDFQTHHYYIRHDPHVESMKNAGLAKQEEPEEMSTEPVFYGSDIRLQGDYHLQHPYDEYNPVRMTLPELTYSGKNSPLVNAQPTSTSCQELETLVGPCMEEMKMIILKEVLKDVDTACATLGLSPDPYTWSEEESVKWIIWTVNQYNLPLFNASLFNLNGRDLCSLTEAEMRTRAPRCGDILHAHLEIWKTAVESSHRDAYPELVVDSTSAGEAFAGKNGTKDRDAGGGKRNRSKRIKMKCGLVQAGKANFNLNSVVFNEKSNEISEADSTCMMPRETQDRLTLDGIMQDENCATVMTPNHTAGIHLWQFLKELLLQPQSYGQCIRWIDKENGIFKIEDSVEVARLWGIRKNRPAMNYDKLSRSIRQYYKKGIIKKTEVSQRLVYQFVKPVV